MFSSELVDVCVSLFKTVPLASVEEFLVDICWTCCVLNNGLWSDLVNCNSFGLAITQQQGKKWYYGNANDWMLLFWKASKPNRRPLHPHWSWPFWERKIRNQRDLLLCLCEWISWWYLFISIRLQARACTEYSIAVVIYVLYVRNMHEIVIIQLPAT